MLHVISLILLSQIICCATEREIIHPPFGNTRECFVEMTSNGASLLRQHDGEESCPRNLAHECRGYVGMKLVFECRFDVTGIYNAEANRVGNSSVVFSILQLEDAGQYECRANNGRNYVFNITVSEAIGVDPLFCNSEFSYNATYDCFENKTPILIMTEYFVPRKFYSFGTRNVTAHSEWLTPSYHYPTDIGIQTEINSTSAEIMLKIQNHPRIINSEYSMVLAIISASNSQSICVHLQFRGIEHIFTNLSLPLDAEVHEGEEAIFQCVLGTTTDSTNYFLFEYSGDTNTSTYYGNHWECSNNSHPLTCVKERRPDQYAYVWLTFTFHVSNVSIKDHGSNFSCTLEVGHPPVIQWKNTATLSVTKATDSIRDYKHIIYIVIPALIFVLTVAVAVVLISTAGRRVLNKKLTVPRLNLELMSLSRSKYKSNIPSSINPLSEQTITNENQQQSNVLQMSDADHLTPELRERWTEKCIVYVSYTDTKAMWVRNYLQSLIDSCEYCEVRLHEDHMIPGFTISGERQRLILEAHKVILVVSKDYSESGWCLYELQHAIQQEPALCNGRIIPILVDGCQTLPSIVEGVVALQDDDINFKNKLMQSITER